GVDLRPGATRGPALPPFDPAPVFAPPPFLAPGVPAFGARPSDAALRRSFSCFQAVRSGTGSSPEYALCQGRSSAGRVRPRPARPCRFLPPEPTLGPLRGVARRLRRCELPAISGPPTSASIVDRSACPPPRHRPV